MASFIFCNPSVLEITIIGATIFLAGALCGNIFYLLLDTFVRLQSERSNKRRQKRQAVLRSNRVKVYIFATKASFSFYILIIDDNKIKTLILIMNISKVKTCLNFI